MGSIVGRVERPAATRVVAVERATDKKYPGTLDPRSGRFSVEGLPLGGTFDLLIDGKDGARLEGINLGVPRSDYEEEQPLAPEDVATINQQVRRLNSFEDQVDILAVAGNVQHAAVLVNKLRHPAVRQLEAGRGRLAVRALALRAAGGNVGQGAGRAVLRPLP